MLESCRVRVNVLQTWMMGNLGFGTIEASQGSGRQGNSSEMETAAGIALSLSLSLSLA